MFTVHFFSLTIVLTISEPLLVHWTFIFRIFLWNIYCLHGEYHRHDQVFHLEEMEPFAGIPLMMSTFSNNHLHVLWILNVIFCWETDTNKPFSRFLKRETHACDKRCSQITENDTNIGRLIWGNNVKVPSHWTH